MKQNRRLALLFIATSLVSIPALAASVTMLQFGSFETREEAEKRLTEIKSKYAAQVAGLEASVREIKLPPDNLTVYRTQAGPVADRPAAQSICTKLAASGDECYIVQTAMVADAVAPPAPAVSGTKPLEFAKSEPVKATAAAEPVKADPMSKLSTTKEVPARDPESAAALSSVRAVTPAEAPAVANAKGTPAEPDYTATPPSPEMQNALDKAAAEQSKNADQVDQAISDVQNKKTRSFWSRMNPFSDDEPVAEVKPAAALEPVAAPVEAVKVTPVSPVAVEAPAVKTPGIAAAASAPAALAAMPETPVVKAEPAPVAVIPPQPAAPLIITQAEPMHLPPPPAPLKGSELPQIAQKPSPVSTGIVNAPVPVIPPAPLAANGNVSVEEAKRVPVTEAAMPAIQQAPLAPPALVATKPTLPAASSLQPPSATDGQKTIWAQIGPFKDGASAINYWNGYRLLHPDFPVVRVRAISSYQQQMRGTNETWLRVGPMARSGSVSYLCSGVVGSYSNLRCGQVTDLGAATVASKGVGLMSGSRYQR